MTASEIIILFWLLPSLIVLFLCLQYDKHESNRKIECIPSSDWRYIIFITIVWPLGLCFMIAIGTKPFFKFLVKERSFRTNKGKQNEL